MTNDTPRKAPKIAAAREILWNAGYSGLTWRDYADATGAHHGAASGMLSRLHRDGDALRLAEKRGADSVYVAPEFRINRDIVPPKKRAAEPIAPLPVASETPPAIDMDAVWRDAYAEGVAAGRAHERTMAENARAEHDEAIRLAGFAEGVAQGVADLEAARSAAFADGVAKGRADAPPTEDAEAARREGFEAGRAQAEAEWQAGYDEGVKVGGDIAIAEMKQRMVDAGGEPYLKGRAVGRKEGEEALRRHATKVAAEIARAIRANGSPVKTHHSTCWMQHPECAVKAVVQGIGVTPDRFRSEVNVA
jgi:hypothetical protein